MNAFLVEFLMRPGCHLCDEARPRVERAVALSGGRLVVRNIDEDDALTRDFGVRIPVVRVGDRVVADGTVNGTGRLWRSLLRARFSRGRG